MSRSRLWLVLAIALIVRPCAAQSISGVSGTLTHGSTVTLSGSSFGSGGAPLKYEDLTGCSNGQNIATCSTASGPSWSNNGGLGDCQFQPTASNSRLRSGVPWSVNWLSHWQPSGTNADCSNLAIIGQAIARIYLDFSMYFDMSSAVEIHNDDAGEIGMNEKWFRLHQTGAGAPNAYAAAYSATCSGAACPSVNKIGRAHV